MGLKSSFGTDDLLRMPFSQTPLRTEKILLVEDDKSISDAFAVLFRHYEYQVTVASTLAEGQAALSTGFDLILLDLLLPDGDGTEILQQVRVSGITSKVFVLTGSTDKTAMLKIRRFMPEKFFRKPLNFLEILDAAREVLTPALPPEPRITSFLDTKWTTV